MSITATESLSTLQNSSAPLANKEEKGKLGGRLFSDWRTFPSLLALVSNIIAATYAVLHARHLLSVFCPGILASICAIHLNQDLHELKSLADNNDIYRENNLEMQKKLEVLEAENAKIKESAATLTRVSGEFHQENETLKGSNQKLTDTVSNLEETTDKHVKQLGLVTGSLKGIEDSVKEDHRVFSTKLAVFVETVDKLVTLETSFHKTGHAVENTMHAYTEAVMNTTKSIKEICNHFSQWMDDEGHAKKVAELQHLLQQTVEASQQLGSMKKSVEIFREQNEKQVNLNKELEETAGRHKAIIAAYEGTLSKLIALYNNFSSGLVQVEVKDQAIHNKLDALLKDFDDIKASFSKS